MDRHQKLELIKRSLGIRHKLKVHESMQAPDTHEELASILLAKWDLEDELHAIEELILEFRTANITHKKEGLANSEPKENLSTPLFSRDGRKHLTEKKDLF